MTLDLCGHLMPGQDDALADTLDSLVEIDRKNRSREIRGKKGFRCFLTLDLTPSD